MAPEKWHKQLSKIMTDSATILCTILDHLRNIHVIFHPGNLMSTLLIGRDTLRYTMLVCEGTRKLLTC